MIEFYKYEGTGNDFILVDNRSRIFTGNKIEFAKRWCDRRFGVGSDGLIFIEEDAGSDFRMDFYNPDGSQSFCGNGSRCAVRFAEYLGIIKGNSSSFKAIDDEHFAEITNDTVRVKMKDSGPVQHVGGDFFIHTGSPHYISYETNEIRDILAFGRQIRYSDAYKPAGTNVNLVEETGDRHIRIRTYERGVENETWSCGTGATACALTYAFKHDLAKGTIIVDVRGGRLKVDFKNAQTGFSHTWLEGPARFVFKGTLA
jgi:diaminopimelate epimerase